MKIRNEKMAIYKILNKVNGKGYIGSAMRLSSRWSEHRKRLERKKHHSILLQRAWDKYGEDQFSFEIIELINDKNQLKIREQYWLDYYKSYLPENGYNIRPDASSPLGTRASKETREKQSLAHKGKKLNLTDEERNRRRQFMLGNTYGLGISPSEETIEKIRQSQLGKVIPEHVRKALIGNKFGLGNRSNTGKISPNKGKELVEYENRVCTCGCDEILHVRKNSKRSFKNKEHYTFFRRGKKIGRRKKRIFNCKNCGKEVICRPSEPKIYCSQTCANIGRNIQTKRICLICNFEFYKPPSIPNKFCSKKCSIVAQQEKAIYG